MATNPEQMQRRAQAWDETVVPAWSCHVNAALVDLMRAVDLGSAPTALVAEARTGDLVERLFEILPERARLMAVDPASEMLDRARDRLSRFSRRIFYSSQSITRLSYADGVFHTVLCANGLLTRGDLLLAGNELLRVLRPEGTLGLAVPLAGTFACFQDMMRESLIRLEMRDLEGSLEDYLAAQLTPDGLRDAADSLELEIVAERTVTFSLAFATAEDFFFSPFVEDLYLPRWLALGDDPDQREPLFFDIVRSLNTYFQGLSLTTPVTVGCFLARRRR